MSHGVRARRLHSDVLISVGALAVLLAILVSIDPRVREQVSNVARGAASPTAVRTAGEQAQEVASVVVVAARERSIEHAPLVLFAVAATLLTVFMLRT